MAPAQAAVTQIGQVQGSGASSPMIRNQVTVQGVVTAVFQGTGQYGGYTIQDAGDGDESTSDGIFVSDTVQRVAVGDLVELTGAVGEVIGQTILSPVKRRIISSGNPLPDPVRLELPLTSAEKERREGMLVTFPASLTIVSSDAHSTFGEVAYANHRLIPATQQTPPAPMTSPNPIYIEENPEIIVMDDGRDRRWAEPFVHPNGHDFTAENYFRLGDTVANLTGVMYQSSGYKLLPSQTRHGDYTPANPRPEAPQRAGNLQVATFEMGMVSDLPGGQNRRDEKVAATLAELGADVVAMGNLADGKNSADALVAGLVARGQADWKSIATTANAQAFLYRGDVVEPVGELGTLAFTDRFSSPVLAQTFRHRDTGELLTLVASNALASRLSYQCRGDADAGDGQGVCNTYRTAAAEKLADWLAADPTGGGAPRTLLLGRLNAYAREIPVTTLMGRGYSDLINGYIGSDAHVQRDFPAPGYTGYASHALVNASAAKDVVDTRIWHIAADESPSLGYHDPFRTRGLQDLYQMNPVASSWVDPVLVSLQLTTPVAEPEPSESPIATPQPPESPTPEPTGSPVPHPSDSPSPDSVAPSASVPATPTGSSSADPTVVSPETGVPALAGPVDPAPTSPAARSTGSQGANLTPVPARVRPGLPKTGA